MLKFFYQLIMRHGKKHNHLGRTKEHRQALLSNLAISLIEHKRIRTTVAKAKALRTFVEPLLTKAKTNTTHSRRVVFSYLQNKDTVSLMFGEVASKIANRPGGYTRIIRAGFRPSDSAEMAYIELVDYNEAALEAKNAKRRATRRGRGAKKAADTTINIQKSEDTSSNTEASSTEQPAE
jgi:large subunit ribosomal protein L17